MTAFFLQQLLALYFAIIYNFQVVKSQVIVREKNSSIYFKKFIDLDFFYTDIFFHFLLRKAYAVLSAANRFVGSDTMLLTNFENLNSISNIFQETRFLSFDNPTNYLHLFTNHRQTFPWLGERPSSHLKATKMRFAPNIKYLSEPFLRLFVTGKASLLRFNNSLFILKA